MGKLVQYQTIVTGTRVLFMCMIRGIDSWYTRYIEPQEKNRMRCEMAYRYVLLCAPAKKGPICHA